jgi:MFS transporter, UMF1 family
MKSSATVDTSLRKNDPRLINAWCSYDWANSVYNLTVTTTLFPVYYSAATRESFGGDIVSFLGWKLPNTVLYSYAISFSFFVIVLLSPILSGIADYSGRKKIFMQFFTYLGSLSCIGLYFFRGDNLVYGITCAVLASIGYAGALVFYNSFLPQITTTDNMDRVSAKGFSMGYLGSVILLVVNLVIINQYERFGFSGAGEATRFAFLMVGVWWMGFAQIAFYFLRDHPLQQETRGNILLKGFQELKLVLNKVRKAQSMPRYLLSFFFYSMGVQTVILLAPLFGESVIGLPAEKLILTVLLLQIVAIGGSMLFAGVARRNGNKAALAIMLFIWIAICTGAFFLRSELQFFIMAGFVGLVLGGTQAISRSTWSKLIPVDSPDTASYFSLYDVSEKAAIVLGTMAYGFIEQLTGDMRNSSLAMIAFFALGLLALARTHLPYIRERKEG